jgi:hypothetical protein
MAEVEVQAEEIASELEHDVEFTEVEVAHENIGLVELVESPEPRINRRPKKFWSNRRAKLATTVLRITLLCVFGMVTLLVLTPLGIVHPTSPSNASSSVAITLPANSTVHVGDELVVVLGPDIVRGHVSKIGSSTIQIANGTSMIEVRMQDVVGRVVMSIPLVGRLL